MQDQKEVINAIEKFCKVIRKLGSKQVIKVLSELYRDNINDYDDKIVDFIKSETCKAFSIEPESLLKSHATEEVIICRNMSMVLVKAHLDLTHAFISKLFNKKGHVIVSQALNDFKNKNPKIKDHKFFLDTYDSINLLVIEYKEKLNNL